MSFKAPYISRFISFLLMMLMSFYESDRIETLSIPMERAEFMADRITEVSAIKDDETEVSVAACCEEDTKSSMIQPSPAFPIEEFHTASVKILHRLGYLGLGSFLIKGIDFFGGLEG